MDKKELKKLCNDLKPQFNLGKAGLTPTFIETIDKYLGAHEIVKIKVLIAEDKDAAKYFSEELAKETSSEILEQKGFTCVLFREKES